MPLFMQLRADFVEGKVSSFFTLNGGYSFGWLTYEDGVDYGGMFMEPGIGIRINFSKNFGMNLGSTFKFYTYAKASVYKVSFGLIDEIFNQQYQSYLINRI